MFTIKLYRATKHPAMPGGEEHTAFSTVLREAEIVAIHEHRFNELASVEVTYANGSTGAFYIANRDMPEPENIIPEDGFYYAAFIENANGRTTESVRFTP
jgi:hypothetical protein